MPFGSAQGAHTSALHRGSTVVSLSEDSGFRSLSGAEGQNTCFKLLNDQIYRHNFH